MCMSENFYNVLTGSQHSWRFLLAHCFILVISISTVMIQFIMRITGGETDTSKEIEYTVDWEKVKAFVQKIQKMN